MTNEELATLLEELARGYKDNCCLARLHDPIGKPPPENRPHTLDCPVPKALAAAELLRDGAAKVLTVENTVNRADHDEYVAELRGIIDDMHNHLAKQANKMVETETARAMKVAKLVWKNAGLDPEETIDGRDMAQFAEQARGVMEEK